MRVIIQRVKEASVTIESKIYSKIDKGLLVLVGIENADTEEDVDWLVKKVINLRIFDDENAVMNLSVNAIGGEILAVSQFTLHSSTKKGNRPSYIKSAKPDIAIPIYNSFVEKLEQSCNKEIKTGKFGAEMDISLINNGPVTIFMDSKNRE